MSETPRIAAFGQEDDFVTSSGLLDDADVTILSARFGHFTYPGGDTTTTALIVSVEDQDGKKHEQTYSVGDPEKFTPSEDGSQVFLQGSATKINSASNFATFITSLVNAGVDRNLFSTGNITVLDGMKLHVLAQPQKDRSGKEVKNAKGYTRTILLASKLLALPGAAPAKAASKPAAGAPKAAAGKKAAATTAAPEVSETVADKVVLYVAKAAAGEKDGSIARMKVATPVFRLTNAAADPDRLEIAKLSPNKEVLKANSGRPVFDGEEAYSFEYDEASDTIKVAA